MYMCRCEYKKKLLSSTSRQPNELPNVALRSELWFSGRPSALDYFLAPYFVYVYVNTWVLMEPRGNGRSLGSEVTGVCKPSTGGAGIQSLQ